jgi:8-oxo-dGTP pyrophosphatase MutT (NUDIX family)/CYTH domain-containing protein
VKFERRFLAYHNFREARFIWSHRLDYGYLPDSGSQRIRLARVGRHFQLSIADIHDRKLPIWEKRISRREFEELWKLTKGLRIAKIRTRIMWNHTAWDYDEYLDNWSSLKTVKVVFENLDKAKSFNVPTELGPEVTFDERFCSYRMVKGDIALSDFFPQIHWQGRFSIGVIPFLVGGNSLRVVAVSSRKHDRWIFPKGQPEVDLTPQAVALLEAKEEAGLEGVIVGHPVVLSERWMNQDQQFVLFPMAVDQVNDTWREDQQRQRRFFDPLDIEPELQTPLVTLGARVVSSYFI